MWDTKVPFWGIVYIWIRCSSCTAHSCTTRYIRIVPRFSVDTPGWMLLRMCGYRIDGTLERMDEMLVRRGYLTEFSPKHQTVHELVPRVWGIASNSYNYLGFLANEPNSFVLSLPIPVKSLSAHLFKRWTLFILDSINLMGLIYINLCGSYSTRFRAFYSKNGKFVFNSKAGFSRRWTVNKRTIKRLQLFTT